MSTRAGIEERMVVATPKYLHKHHWYGGGLVLPYARNIGKGAGFLFVLSFVNSTLVYSSTLQYICSSLNSHLFCACTEHALYAQADRHDIHSRTPIFVQDWQTYVTVTIDMRMNWYMITNEGHLEIKKLTWANVYNDLINRPVVNQMDT